jgi:hypothetical protein
MTVTASTHTEQFAMRHDRRAPQAGQAPRKGNVASALCIAGFVACCTTPATVWLTQQGLAALSRPVAAAEPARIPACDTPAAAADPA